MASSIKRLDAAIRVVVAALPCVYATGAEAAVAAALPGVDAACAPVESLRLAVRGVRPPCLAPADAGCLLHLGGEPVLSLALAKRLGYPALAFAERSVGFQRGFSKVFLRDTPLRRAGTASGDVVGDLLVDAAHLRCHHRAPRLPGRPLTVGLFAGSRVSIFRHTLPFFVRAARLAQPDLLPVRWIIARADFVSERPLAAVLADASDRALEGDCAAPADPSRPARLVSDGGVSLEIVPLEEALAEADLALTIPGTSNGELAALGIPMLMAAPFGKLRAVPLPGLLGHLERLPVVGGWLKAAAVYAYSSRVPHLGYPNRRAARRVAPELRGPISASDLARALVSLARSDVEAIARDLRDVMGPPGAAARVAEGVIAAMERPVSSILS